MFDVLWASKRPQQFNDLESVLPLSSSEGGMLLESLVVWEEHCVECGQPECFSVCPLFSPRRDGVCRRFTYGISPFKAKKSKAFFYDIHFKKWGKLEGYYFPGLLSSRFVAFVTKLDRFLSRISSAFTQILPFLKGRFLPSRLYRKLRIILLDLLSRRAPCGESCLEMTAFLDERKSVCLFIQLEQSDSLLFRKSLELKPGWNRFSVNLPRIVDGRSKVRMSMQANEEGGFRVIFSQLSIGIGAILQRKELLAAAKPAEKVKCVVWDLDNTVWKGVLVEDGSEMLRLTPGIIDVMDALDKRGIIQSVVSKNSYEQAWPLLEKFGVAKYIVYPAINWAPKSGNVRQIAKLINIGIDTVALVDDSAFERSEVSEQLSSVRVYPETLIQRILDLPEFDVPVTEESRGRRLSYQAEMSRDSVKEAFQGDYLSFLKSCNLVLTFFSPKSEEEISRCSELIQRSNQLNLTGRRYSLPEIVAMLNNPEYLCLGFRCEDRFGVYGTVGFLAVKVSEDELSLYEFVMSCRVAKKRCEHAIVRSLFDRARRLGKRALTVNLVATGKNTPLIDSFKEMPFDSFSEKDGVFWYSILSANDWADEAVVNIVG